MRRALTFSIVVGAAVLAVALAVVLARTNTNHPSVSESPGVSDSGGSSSGSVGSDGAASFVGTASNAVIFIQWTRAGSNISGALQQSILKSPAGSGIDSQAIAFTGTIAGNGLTLQLNEGLGSVTSLTGQLSGSGFSLTYPGSGQGSLITIDFQPGRLREYDHDVDALDAGQYSSPCTLYMEGHDATVEFAGSSATSDCAAFVQGQAAHGNTWTTTPQSSAPPQLSAVCTLSDGSDQASVQDDGGMSFGTSACEQLTSQGWSPDREPGSGTAGGD
ncbi:MAG TPA: hypothetical protein VN544_10690 [Gaiellaceae bacterium]|nr:hypothetical protein [Gaiellaceae bacterium]